MVKEIWKDIPEYKGLYQASNLGRIKSLDRYVNHSIKNKKQKIKGKIKSIRLDSINQCLIIDLSKNGKVKTLLVHRLIAKTFINNNLNKREINHKNGIKTDNRTENLEWCTSSENKIHAIKNNLIKHYKKQIYQYDKNGNLINRFNSITEAADCMNVCISSISNALIGYSKSSCGFIWSYKCLNK